MASSLEVQPPRFGGDASPLINQCLQDAAVYYHADAAHAEELLLKAYAQDPDCLPVYFALYKFYFYKRRLSDAERITVTALDKAAALGGFEPDWRQLTLHSAPWNDINHPAHFYLFSLKALAFIRLRLGHPDESHLLLEKLAQLDPHDQVGGSVIRTLAAGSI
ncbi:MAG: hypothetical protein AB7T07_02730 [Steroidobacteraceae bacterium]